MTQPSSMTVDAAFGLGIDHLEAGRLDAALQVFAAILAAAPGHPQAAYLLGVTLLQNGRAADALNHLSTAAQAEPANWRIGLAYAGALDGLGRFAEAATVLKRVIVTAPDAAQAMAALSALIERLAARPRDASILVRRALTLGLAPADAAALFNLSRALLSSGHAAAALHLLRRGLALAPAMPELVNALAAAALDTLRLSAEAMARRALALAPDRPDYRYNLAGSLALKGLTDDAARAFRQALALAPARAAALNNLGLALKDQSLVEAVLTAHRRALAIEPGNVDLHRNLLAALLYLPIGDEDERFAQHLAFGRAIQPTNPPMIERPRDKERPITIGYLSSDLRDHPVGRALEPVIASHDRSRFRVALYLQGHRVDAITQRFLTHADLARDVTALEDSEIAALMRADGIDILVVAAGRYDRNRPGVAAYRAAPVQVSLHDTATSGIGEMDYLVADRRLVPRHSRERFVERVVRLPSFVVHGPLPELPTRRTAGRPPTFGSLNAPAKLSAPALALWARLLKRVPDARLVLKSKNLFASRALSQRVIGIFAESGIDPSRIEFRAAVEPLEDHLGNYADIDVALDPFPFNGATTTFEALWMGVPVVTLAGERMAGRWTASMLGAIRLDALVAGDEDRYLAIAAALVADSAALDRYRSELRARMEASPLMDGPARARQLERVYRTLFERSRR